ncbi:MAG: lysylphosphatidylglycerol synthase transmembrane domain-containing protein [Candidatus Aminicenantes bacterium]|nr:lysylphosphatidylglycerol synthase transmembrane domain-containing protein [Candidatus Aminicenantes bacterium]
MKLWKVTLILSLSALFVFLFLQRVDFPEIRKIWRTIPLLYPLAFLLLALPQYIVRACRWGVLLSPFKKNIAIASLLNFTLIGFMVSYLLPGRLGEIARPVMLAEKEEIKKSQAIATIINERLFDLLTVMLMLLVYLGLGLGRPSPTLLKLRTLVLLLLPAVLLLFAIITLANSKRFSPRTERLIRALVRLLPARGREKAVSFAVHFIKALNLDLGWAGLLKVGCLSLLHWSIILFSYWLLMRGFSGLAMDLPTTIPFLAVIFVSAAIPTPGMAGSLDLACKYALTGLGSASPATAVAFTILFHFLLLAMPITLGLIALWREGLNFKIISRLKKKDELSTVL